MKGSPLMKQIIAAALSGLLFGAGLTVSHMVDRGRVLGFLDVAGQWDPTLLFVLMGAVSVSVLFFRIILRMPHPLLDRQFYLPTLKDVNPSLVLGAILFGVGWGIAGYCPGPGFAALGLGFWNPVLFLLGLFVGAKVCDWIRGKI